jgi:pyruvate formate lyase activating enzyme
MEGRVGSFETLGTLDGPGVRFVAFVQGCPLRCACCHNPETWPMDGGFAMDSAALTKRALRFKPYFAWQGGLTLSGGEPLCQPAFAQDVLERCRNLGIHTAVDTSGARADGDALNAALSADLVLLDLKFADEESYRRHTGGSLEGPLKLLEALEAAGHPLWIRQVIIPGLNDTPEDLSRLWALFGRCRHVARVELLPFRKLCLEKYRRLGLSFPLADTPETAPETMRRLRRTLYRLSVGRFGG